MKAQQDSLLIDVFSQSKIPAAFANPSDKVVISEAKIKLESGDSPDTILRKETSISSIFFLTI